MIHELSGINKWINGLSTHWAPIYLWGSDKIGA